MTGKFSTTRFTDEELQHIRHLINRQALLCPLPGALQHLFAQRRREEFLTIMQVGWRLLLGLVGLFIALLWAMFHTLLVGRDALLWWWAVGTIVPLVVFAIVSLRLPFFQRHYVGLVASVGLVIVANLMGTHLLAANALLAQSTSFLVVFVITAIMLALRIPLQMSVLSALGALLLSLVITLPMGAVPEWRLILVGYGGTILVMVFVGLLMERQERLNFLQGFLLEYESAERMRLNIVLERLAAEDQLTGLANRRRFDNALHHEWERCQRNGQPLALLFIDVDHFKRFNDRYGHGMGDQCLTAVARAIKDCLLRPADLAARYGGEEFVVMLPETPVAGAEDVAERIRSHINALDIPHEASDAASHVTASIGLVVQVPERNNTSQSLLEAADQALYAAKHGGRNCIRSYKNNVVEIA